MRSLDGWRRLERETGTTLLTATGGLDIGDHAEIELLAAQCEWAGVRVERLSAQEAARRFPMFRFGGPEIIDPTVMYHAASTVNAEAALVALRAAAERDGATFRTGVRVEAIDPIDDGHVVVRHSGGTIGATTCVITVGAWAGESLVQSAIGSDTPLPELTVTQEQVAYYRPTEVGAWPTFVDRSEPCVYGLPTPDGLVKIGEHHTGAIIDVEAKTDTPEPVSWERLQAWVRQHVPGVDLVPVRSSTCLYASYPGDTFLFDRVGPVVLGLGLSGHGFKFVPEVGRRLADLGERFDDPHNPFGLDRPPIDVGASGRR